MRRAKLDMVDAWMHLVAFALSPNELARRESRPAPHCDPVIAAKYRAERLARKAANLQKRQRES